LLFLSEFNTGLERFEYHKPLEKLLDLGFTVEQASVNGQTPISIAVGADIHVSVRLFLDRGARPSKEDFTTAIQKLHVLSLSVLCTTTEVDEYFPHDRAKLVHNASGENLLHMAVGANAHTLALFLVNHGFDLHTSPAAVNEWEDTGAPIHLAAQKGLTKILVVLLDAGADINATNNYYRNSPLHLAASFNNTDCVQSLLDRGADLTKKNSSDETPLDVAIGECRQLIIKHKQTTNP